MEFDNKPGMSKEELLTCVGDYDGIAIRSATKITKEVIVAAKKQLKVVGRASRPTSTVLTFPPPPRPESSS